MLPAPLRDRLRRITPLRRAYRFLYALCRRPLGLGEALAYAGETLFVSAAARAAKAGIAAWVGVSLRAGEDEAVWRRSATAWAERNRRGYAADRRRLALVDDLVALAPTSVLEVGCNFGANLALLAERVPTAQLVGIDVGVAALRCASAPGRALLAGASAYALPFRTASFSVVFTSALIMHLPASDARRGLEELLRVSGAYVVLVEYRNPSEPPGIEHLGADFRIYNHDYAGWLAGRGDVDVAKDEESREAVPGMFLRTIILRKRGALAC